MAQPPHLAAILANTQREAFNYGAEHFRGYMILPITIRANIYLLYGKHGMPYDIVPGTYVQWWHQQLQHHVNYGRLVRVRTHEIRGRLQIGDKMLEMN